LEPGGPPNHLPKKSAVATAALEPSSVRHCQSQHTYSLIIYIKIYTVEKENVVLTCGVDEKTETIELLSIRNMIINYRGTNNVKGMRVKIYYTRLQRFKIQN